MLGHVPHSSAVTPRLAPRVGCLVGSLSSTSINRLLADALTSAHPLGAALEPVLIADLPVYSPDFDTAFPPAAVAFKAHLAELDAVLFVTPEYNRSMSGALKNALDWGSRPFGANSWDGLPAAIVGTGLNGAGTAVAQAHLRAVLGYLGMAVLGAPETCIAWHDGVLEDVATRARLTALLAAFELQVDSTTGRPQLQR